MITAPLLLLLAAPSGLSEPPERNNATSEQPPVGSAAAVLYGRLTVDHSRLPPRRSLTLHLEPGSVIVPLLPVTDLVSSQFSVWVRNGSEVSEDRLVPLPTCLFAGHTVLPSGRHLDLSVSTCGGGGDDEEVRGNIVLDGEHYVLKADGRAKRQVEDENTHQEVLMVQAAAGDGECGLNIRNKKRLRVEERPVVLLPPDPPRTKRSTQARYIEVAVFVDNVMYANVEAKKSPEEDTVKKIREMVFAYLNAVQVMYQSGRLANKLKVVLVRLDIMQAADPSLNKHGGDIERYLEAFCLWQKGKNPGSGSGTADRTNAAHWDHALLLTGLNLYDGSPARDSVIGLAWVRYASVFVWVPKERKNILN
jgi:hypothetical protein